MKKENFKLVTINLPDALWEKLDNLWRTKKIKSKTQFFTDCVENFEKVLKVLEKK